ncbi:hypothetical protein ACHWQZ_G016896 [Mnemiopsis leidyi]
MNPDEQVTVKDDPPQIDPLDRSGGVDDEEETTSALGPKPSDKAIPRIPSIRPSTPDRGTPSEDLEEHLGPDDSASQTGLDRAQLLEKYQQALNERDKILNLNSQCQHKIAEHFRKKKGADERQEVEKSVTDQEQRYMKCLQALDELELENELTQKEAESRSNEEREKMEEKKNLVDEMTAQYFEFKKGVAKQAVNSRSGKPLALKDIEQYIANEKKKEEEVIAVRLENIKLINKLKKRETQLKQKEELADGLHLIDFEQLKIENQTYNEKIEERNEELLKLRKKITTTVQVLTHVKEKLQFVTGENAGQRENLKLVEYDVAKKRDILSRTKQARDSLRIDNVKLRKKCGLIGQEALLRDLEVRKDDTEGLNKTIEDLQTRHMELLLQVDGVRQKVDAAKVHAI